MKLTIIETGRPPEPIAQEFPRYPQMLESLVAPHVPGLQTEVVSLVEGAALPRPETVEALMVTGSPHGVYDPIDWIQPLKSFMRRLAAQGAPQVGICFGHQLMAEAFGGRAARAPQGWGLGRHTYALHASEPFMADHCGRAFHMAVSHQDQVLEKPDVADVIASSAFTPFAALAYRHAPALSFQGHPEFCPRFARALIESRRGTRFAPELADRAIASLDGPLDGALVGRWIGRFLLAQAGAASAGRAAA